MKTDIRTTALYQEIETLYRNLRQPGSGQISDAAEAHASPDGQYVAFTGTLVGELDGPLPTRICTTRLSGGETQVRTFGPHSDRGPKFAPDSRQIAFLSDRHARGDFQLYLLDLESGAARGTPRVEGWVEYVSWSPDGRSILLGVAGHGADVAGGQGAISSQQRGAQLPAWMPDLDTGDETFRWRSVWIYDVAAQTVRQVSPAGVNVWECAWCGNEALAAVISPGPGEGLWYSAHLTVIDIETAARRQVYRPTDQLGWPAVDPSGKYLAVVEALCSDRWFVAGDLRLVELASGRVRQVDTLGIDVTYTEWRSTTRLLLAGLRGFATVVALYDLTTGTVREIWSSQELTVGGIAVTVSGVQDAGDCVILGESFFRAPEVAVIRQGAYTTVKSFDVDPTQQGRAVATVERITWPAPDGLEIQGWLLLPPKAKGEGLLPLVTRIHGGPVGHWKATWLGRGAGLLGFALLKRGYAVFMPNPRGSSGRGQAFARHVFGEMGGAETQDHLSGLDFLVKQGVADPARLGVTGVSHGGYMTSWLITQDNRFAAAVPVAPVTSFVSQHLISNIPHFLSLFLQDKFNNPAGKYFQRSPVMHAHNVKTPTLNVCGALDRCTPPEEAVQFHNALLENGVRSVLAMYPQEGHGISKLPALFDYTARVIGWFDAHMAGRG